MAEKPNYKNKTGTDLDILKNLERTYRDAHGGKADRNTKESMDWFRKRITKNFSTVRTARMFRDKKLWKDKIQLGRMYFYEYDAMTKDELPVWDRYPMIIPFNAYKSAEGKQIVLGLNFHYLPPALRMIAFRALLKYAKGGRYNKQTKLQFQWETINALAQNKYFKHAVKAYRVDHFRSKLVEIPAQSWEMALFLPLARFQKGGKAEAWKII